MTITKSFWGLVAAIALVCSTGCSNLSLLEAQNAYRQGDLATAQIKIDTYSDKNLEGRNAIIAWLEKGSVYRSLGDYDASNQAFECANQQFEYWDMQPEFKVGDESAAMLTNLNMLPYRGYNYDRIMLYTYRALNYMQLGDVSAARVEMTRALNAQREAVARNAKRLEKAEEMTKSESDEDRGFNTDKTLHSDALKLQLASQYGELEKNKIYADYINPFTEFLQGIYFLHASMDASDLDRASMSIKRVLGMESENEYLREDYQAALRIKAGSSREPVTYIIYETGVAPSREAIRLDLPLFLVNDEVDYVGMSFPSLVMHSEYHPVITIAANGRRYPTRRIASMDSIVSQEFQNDLPIVVTKTVMNAATKAAAAWASKQASKGDEGVHALVSLTTLVYQVATNEADLRTWATLPKEFQYARIATPTTRSLELSLGDQIFETVDLEPGQVNVIYVKSIAPGVTPQISQFVLRK